MREELIGAIDCFVATGGTGDASVLGVAARLGVILVARGVTEAVKRVRL
jgi:hypothetical protein